MFNVSRGSKFEPLPPTNGTHLPTKLAINNTFSDNDLNNSKLAHHTANPFILKSGWSVWYHREYGKFYYVNDKRETTWARPDEITNDDERRAFIRSYIETELKHIDTHENRIAETCLEQMQNFAPGSYLMKFFADADLDKKKALITEVCSEYFRMLLDEKMFEPDEPKKLKPNSSWEAATKLLQHDRRFHLLTRPSEKKAVFNEWKQTAPERERKTKELNFEAYCTMMGSKMVNHKEFNPNLDYTTAQNLFGKEEYFTAVPANERRAVFEKIMERVHKTIEKEEEKYRKDNIQSLANILKEMQNITAETSWAQAQRLLAQHPSFQSSASLMNMDKEDALCVFSTHIRGLIEEYREMRDRNKTTQYRKERKAREKFQDLLVELREKNIITLKTKWKEIAPLLCKENRFVDMLYQSGPTPLDFFKFFIVDWNNEFKNNLNFVIELMEKKNFDFSLNVPPEMFYSFVETNTKSDEVNRVNYTHLYDHFLCDLIDKTSKQENAADSLRGTFMSEITRIDINALVNLRDAEAVLHHFKTRWQISDNLQGLILKLNEEYLTRQLEEGELNNAIALPSPDYNKRTPSMSEHSSRSPTPERKKKHKKERKTRKRSHHSSEKEYEKPKKKRHRRHRSSSEDSRDDRYYRNHKDSRRY